MSNLTVALVFTLKEEGGFVDNPADHGGATNRGITQRVYDAWRDSKSLPRQSVEFATTAETDTIYDEEYWQPGKCDHLPLAVAVTHFDWCVNHGVAGANKTLQHALAMPVVDGIIGPATLAAVADADVMALVHAYQALRIGFYHADVVADPGQARFLAGWLNRVTALSAYVEAL